MRASDRLEFEHPADCTIRPSIDDGFTLMLAGDLISSRPPAPKLASDPRFAAGARLLGEAPLALGNLETGIVHAGAGETLAYARTLQRVLAADRVDVLVLERIPLPFLSRRDPAECLHEYVEPTRAITLDPSVDGPAAGERRLDAGHRGAVRDADRLAEVRMDVS